MPRLKGVFFDLDDTLYSTTHFAHQARTNALKAMQRHGLKFPLADLERELDEVVHEFSSNYDQHFDKLLVRLPPESRNGVNPAILIAAGIRAYHDTKYEHLKPHEDALRFLKALAKTRLIRGVITAGLEMKQAEKILRLGIYECLSPHAIFISEQIGISKPSPKIYSTAASRCGLKPGECMYIGNSLAHDIKPAKIAGMITVLVTREARIDAEGVHPDYRILTFDELFGILKKDFKINLE
jgi:putative hydrolase of the HAD superfamily